MGLRPPLKKKPHPVSKHSNKSCRKKKRRKSMECVLFKTHYVGYQRYLSANVSKKLQLAHTFELVKFHMGWLKVLKMLKMSPHLNQPKEGTKNLGVRDAWGVTVTGKAFFRFDRIFAWENPTSLKRFFLIRHIYLFGYIYIYKFMVSIHVCIYNSATLNISELYTFSMCTK